MITLLDVNKAVNDRVKMALKGCFDYDVPTVAEDLSEPIIRPSIKVIPEGLTVGKFNSSCKERTLTYRVYFFSKDRKKPKFENTKVQEALESEFINDLAVSSDFIIPIEDISFEISDGILIMTFELYTIELLPDNDTNEMMEELEVKM